MHLLILETKGGDYMAKRVIVTRESASGRNLNFSDSRTGKSMSRAQFVREIRSGNYDDYHVRTINGIATPVSNPDGSSRNNLG